MQCLTDSVLMYFSVHCSHYNRQLNTVQSHSVETREMMTK